MFELSYQHVGKIHKPRPPSPPYDQLLPTPGREPNQSKVCDAKSPSHAPAMLMRVILLKQMTPGVTHPAEDQVGLDRVRAWSHGLI